MATAEVRNRQEVVDDFHRLHYEGAADGGTWADARWHGIKCWKQPADMWLYQELIFAVRPAFIIETGTAFGGSALFYAHQLDQIGYGRVLSIDIQPYSFGYPRHPRIEYLCGRSSVDPLVRRELEYRDYVGPVMVSLDSDHSESHVLAELEAYAPLVTPNSYLVVEDTNVHGHPVYPEHGPGPWEAVEKWLPQHPEFVEDTRLPKRWFYSYHRWFKRRRV